MRPVWRGGAPKSYARYNDAIDDLEDRLGRYCSYCERPDSLAVEHVSPKSKDPANARVWDNFLLACKNCNSIKGAKPATPAEIPDYLWPDRDNTLMAFRYEKDGYISVRIGLPAGVDVFAEKLLSLVGLNRHKFHAGARRPTKRDKRWSQREEVWKAAELCKANLTKLGDDPAARELVVEVALGRGFFSVWMEVFSGDDQTRLAIIQRMTGTAPDCFQTDGTPQNRPGGRI